MIDTIPANVLNEIVLTLLVFLSSANREIVKSTLGFIKLAVHVLPESLMRPQLYQLVPALLGWAHDHKNHFKTKVRHIFERMIRRFGFQEVYSCAKGEEASKVLVNIKKRKDRAKRKRAHAGDASDEVLFHYLSYNLGYSGRPHREHRRSRLQAMRSRTYCTLVKAISVTVTRTKRKILRQKGSAGAGTSRPAYDSTMTNLWICSREQLLVLRVSNNTPCSHCQQKKSRIFSIDARGRRQSKNQDTTCFKTDEETGKIVIEESDSDAVGVGEPDVAGTAYRETLTSVDGFTRGPGGRIKFNKDTKKRRRENAIEDEDVEMVETEPARIGGKKKSDVRLGHEFKAKVWIELPSFQKKC